MLERNIGVACLKLVYYELQILKLVRLQWIEFRTFDNLKRLASLVSLFEDLKKTASVEGFFCAYSLLGYLFG